MTGARQLWVGLTGGVLAALLGTLAVVNSAAAAGAAVAALVVTLAVVYSAALPKAFLVGLGGTLLGYAFFNRGFAYVGHAPLFVGEVVLGLGVCALIATQGVGFPTRTAIPAVLLVFMGWGAARTLPFLGEYGIDALRDAVVWGYALFAIAVATCLRRTGWLERLPEYYGRWILPFAVWVPAAWAIFEFAYESIPYVPGSTVRLLSFKPGDSAVHLAGAAAFTLVGLARPASPPGAREAAGRTRGETVFWLAWTGSFLLVASFNRGGLLAIAAAMAVVVLLGRRAVRPRVVRAGAVALSLGATLLALEVAGVATAIRPPDAARSLSVEQLVHNVVSIGGGGKKDGLEGSRTWRLMWWGKIVDYTVHGPYFWGGKGFVINLATDDGFQVDEEEQLRSPHNGHLSILARAGVPGVVLWVLLQLTVAGQLAWAHLRAQREEDGLMAQLTLWLLAYWAAYMVNVSFDVYLEGPQGGVWFWSTVGVAVAVVEEQRRRSAARSAGWPARRVAAGR